MTMTTTIAVLAAIATIAPSLMLLCASEDAGVSEVELWLDIDVMEAETEKGSREDELGTYSVTVEMEVAVTVTAAMLALRKEPEKDSSFPTTRI